MTTTPVLPRFDLTDLYPAITDEKLILEVDRIEELAKDFKSRFSGKLILQLGESLEALRAIHQYTSKVMLYLHLCFACDATNATVQKVSATVKERVAGISANNLNFFEHELVKTLSLEELEKKASTNETIKFYYSYIKRILERAPHLLSEEVERALTIRAPFAENEWEEYYDHVEATLTFSIGQTAAVKYGLPKGKHQLSAMLHMISENPNAEARFEAMKLLNRGLQKDFAEVSTRALNVVFGAKSVEDKERGYKHPMAARNQSNMISDAVVDALHQAVRTEGVKQAKCYYKLLAAYLKKDKLTWADRLAKVYPELKSEVDWPTAVTLVTDAYTSFSPALGQLVSEQLSSKFLVDADVYKGKTSGAFNYSVEIPEGVRSYTLMNYLGSARDVMTLAHELGHGVHGLLAGKEQGALMMHAPLAYCETASVFGEMLVFDFLKNKAQTPGHTFKLIMDKCADFLGTVVRQISFSRFEQLAHTQRAKGKLTTEEFRMLWLSITQEFYGKEGEVFTFAECDYLWTYIGHFLRPFYVYAYSFGEILTHTLYARRAEIGADFEPLYLQMLQAGGTKDAVALLKPFGLDPTDPAFWQSGIEKSIGKMLDEAESLFASLHS